MEKMNQVSVSEFFAKSKEEMYDMAVEMVEKYNRLIDICNDSAERMADLMSKDSIDEFKKELQSKEIGEFKIQKLADVIVWADNWIEELRMDFPYVTEEEFENFQAVSELEAVKEVVNNAIKRHAVYTEALKNDIASKDAKIDKLEKEIEGRKKAFNNLREEMANRYIAIETHNDICKTYENDIEGKDKYIKRLENQVEGLNEELREQDEKIERQRENNDLKKEVKKLNKCIMEKNETINTANDAIVNLRSEIGAHEEENKKLEKRIEELKETMMVEEYNSTARINRLTSEIEKLKVDLIHEREKNEKLAKAHAGLENEIKKLNIFLKMQEDLTRDWKNKYVEAQKELDEWESDTSEHDAIVQYKELVDGLNKDNKYWKTAFETQATDLAEVRKLNDELVDTLDKSNDEIEKLENQVKYLEKEIEETCKTKELDLKNHNKRDMALVDELAGKNDLIKNLVQEIDYYKNQERIRRDQLRATESKVDQLWREKEEKEKDHGKSGFTEYIKYIITEEEGKFKAELNKRFSEEVSKISQERTEEELAKVKLNKKFGVGGVVDEFKEETEVKGVGRTSSGRYPWGAKVNQHEIPCGEDAIE